MPSEPERIDADEPLQRPLTRQDVLDVLRALAKHTSIQWLTGPASITDVRNKMEQQWTSARIAEKV